MAWKYNVSAESLADVLARNAELRAELEQATQAIHDLQQESTAYQLGVEAERRRVVELVKSEISECQQKWDYWHTHGDGDTAYAARGQVKCLQRVLTDIGQPTGQPLPPDVLRAENERLRQALQHIASGEEHDGLDDASLVRDLINLAKDALQEQS